MDTKVFTHETNPEHSLSLVDNWKITLEQKKKVREFVRDYSIGKVTGRIGNNSPATMERNLTSLKLALENLKAENKKDVEDFLDKLIHDKIKTEHNKHFSTRSKKAILGILYKFLTWKGKTSIAQSLNIKIKEKEREPPSLTEEEVEKLFKAVSEPKYQYFLAVLYSSGARAEEFHNIRFSDIQLPTKENGDEFVKLTLRKEYSKTKGRTISLYSKNVLPSVKRYLNQRINEGIKPNEPIFLIKYVSMRKWLQRLGKKVLGYPVHYHLFRHTLATHLSSKMNRQQLCIYFGWKFSSPMPDIYIQRSGVEMQQIDEKFEKAKTEELENKLEEYREENKQLVQGYVNILNALQEIGITVTTTKNPKK